MIIESDLDSWKLLWNTPDPDHCVPKLSCKESLQLFTSVLDLYGNLVNGYERWIITRDNYKGCTLQQMFRVNDYLDTCGKQILPFMRSFVFTQV